MKIMVVVLGVLLTGVAAASGCKEALRQYQKGVKAARIKAKPVRRACAGKKVKTGKCMKAISKLQKAHSKIDIDLVNAACAPP